MSDGISGPSYLSQFVQFNVRLQLAKTNLRLRKRQRTKSERPETKLKSWVQFNSVNPETGIAPHLSCYLFQKDSQQHLTCTVSIKVNCNNCLYSYGYIANRNLFVNSAYNGVQNVAILILSEDGPTVSEFANSYIFFYHLPL